MPKDDVKVQIVIDKPKDSDKHIDDETEIIVGIPGPAPKSDVHPPDNEREHDKHFNSSNNKVDETDLEQPLQPLLEPTRPRQVPPLAGPEIDDLGGETVATPKDAAPYLADTGRRRSHSSDAAPAPLTKLARLLRWGPGSFGNPAGSINVNSYQQKKNLAQGMMDLALLSANANQLRYVLESSDTHPYYYSSLVFISLSIIFQILVGVGLIMNSRYDVNKETERCKADQINDMTILGIFLITIVNVFITSFSVATQTVSVPQQAG